MLWGFERSHVAHHGGLRLERSAPAATVPAHGTDGSKRRVNLRTWTANNAGSGCACRRERGDGDGGVLGLACRRNPGPGTAKLEGDETAPRGCERPWTTSTGTRARWPPPGRRLGWWRWWRDRREGERSAEGKRDRAARAPGVWVRAPVVRGTRRERMGPRKMKASRARI